MDTRLDIKDLSLRIGSRLLFAHISHSFVGPGVHGIVGPSGCGKSTLVKLIHRQIDRRRGWAISGDILLNGISLLGAAMAPDEVRRTIGVILQQPCAFPGFSVWGDLDFTLRHTTRFDRSERERRIDEALETVGLAREVPSTLSAARLSGGQLQRLALARLLCQDPEMIVFDEPTSALDPVSARAVAETISAIGLTKLVLLITHDINILARVARHVLVLGPDDLGATRAIESGPMPDVAVKPRHRFTRAFFDAHSGTEAQR